ncbi:glycosyltransferase [Nonomuraea guangzhouensis]|uniref:Glycosyltransferase n=1 Tax=Nonomuraea guangzhouensis TaxID=1291555 RepID=A0ABW4G605_9ACTN|nr:glycosyltransferase [Nonomuraea guangzhouensis]
MRVAVLAMGSRGDIQPCVALAQEFGARGHEVTLVAPERYERLAVGRYERPGVRFAALGVDPVAIVESEEGQAWLRSGPLGFVRGLRAVVEPLAATLLTEVDAACADAELVLAPALGSFGRHLHERYGMPYGILQFQPSEPTGEFPNPLIPRRTLGRIGNRASYAAVERLGWLMLAPMVNRLRGQVLGLRPLRGSPFAADRRDRVPVLCGVSPLVVPRPYDWPDYVHLTGYWCLSPDPGSSLPSDLAGFLDDGPPPVYVGFGSMVPDEPEAVAEQVVAAVRLAGVRAVVQGLPVAASADVCPVGEVTHEVLFPRMAAVVHHGGAGTTAAGLAAGVPNVVCPFFSDQPFWGRRVAVLGAGPPPLPIRALSGRSLAARLRAVPEYNDKAAQLGKLLKVERGVKNAVDLIEGS